jgi:hypothetical protein
MSTEPQPEDEYEPGTGIGGDGGELPPIPIETPEEPTPIEVPPAPVGDTIVWEPQTWYAITYACLTTGCPNQNQVKSAPMFYSNNGDPKYIRVFDSTCRTDSKILTAQKLDPQPIEE